uniref:Sodium-coupled monocarboxylate transporter 1 n=1 Tax=Timema cristinae TaxID=61476 RepID=A0A7R9CYK3_TIMCR|nr:unnamed protein product [Timema cristinae]
MNTTIASVQDVINSLERFGVADYVVFVLMLAVCAVIGIYYGFFDGEVTAAKYLDGGKNMNTFPVSLSLIASIISGITLLGTPTEIYVYGGQYVYFCIGIFLMTPLVNKAYIPVFRELGISFTYEYLQRRFNKKVRLLGSMLFIVKQVVWLPIVMYVPALAFSLAADCMQIVESSERSPKRRYYEQESRV